jgi:hypothetical protein
MIIARIQGRVGNELFQASALHNRLARGEHLVLIGPKVALDSPTLHGRITRVGFQRTIVIDVLTHLFRLARGLRLIGRIEAEECDGRLMPRVSRGILPIRFSCESFFQDPAIVSGGPTVRLPASAQAHARSIHDNDLGDIRVAVHVRRGDYLRWGPYGPAALPWEYYEAAILRIRGLFNSGTSFRFLFLSDDLDYVAKQTLGRDDCVAVDCEESAALAVMAASDYLVLSASTFSWWGSELARRRNPSRVAVAPLYWAGWPGGSWYPLPFASDQSLEWLSVQSNVEG